MIGKYMHPDNNPVLQAAKKNDRDHSPGVEPNIHADQISGFDNCKHEKVEMKKIRPTGKK